MPTIGSISQLIPQAKDGDQTALGELHQRYWPSLVERARWKLGDAPLRDVDEEDIAQAAFVGFFHTVRAGRIPDLENRHQLLALLTHIVACKALNEMRRARSVKRGEGQPQSASPLEMLVTDAVTSPLQQAILNDCYEFYVSRLPERLRTFGELHVAGLTNKEIAHEMDCAERTVNRKLALLRTRWREMAWDSVAELPEFPCSSD